MSTQPSFFRRFIAYILCYLVFLQQPLVIAAELVSLERAELYKVRSLDAIPENPSLAKGLLPTYFYVQRFSAKTKALNLQFSPDLEKLDTILAFFGPTDTKPVAALARTLQGFRLDVYKDYSLTLDGTTDLLPPLFVASNSPVLIQADRLVNPLTIQASSVDFLKAMRVDGSVVLWAKGEQGVAAEEELESITVTTKDQAGQDLTLEAKGPVRTKGLKGPGSLTVFAGRFHNAHHILLKQLQIIANIENEETGDLCGRDSLWLEGRIKNKGFVRTRGSFVEKGSVIQHTKTARTFAGLSHQVQARSHIHNGRVYSAGSTRVQAEVMKFGPSFHFRGSRLIGDASATISTHSTSYFEALWYIELSSLDDFANSARVHVHTFDFPYREYFGDLTNLDDSQEAFYVKAIEDLRESLGCVSLEEWAKQKDDVPHGVFLSSSGGTFFQSGTVDTTTSDVVFKGESVGHGGITRSGTACPGSVKVIAQSAHLGGEIRASQGVEAYIQGPLTMNLLLESPFTAIFANSFDLSGEIRTAMTAKVSGAVRFLDGLRAHAIGVESASLTLAQSPGSTAGTQQIGSLDVMAPVFTISAPTQIHTLNAKADSFINANDLTLLGHSRIEAPQISNTGHMKIDQQLALKVHNTSGLGSITGPGCVDIDAERCDNPEATLFGETSVRPDAGISLTIPHDMTIEREHTAGHRVNLTAPGITILANQVFQRGGMLWSTRGLSMPSISMTSWADMTLHAANRFLDATNSQISADRLYVSATGDGYFNNAVVRAPQLSMTFGKTLFANEAEFYSKGKTSYGSAAFQRFDVGCLQASGKKEGVSIRPDCFTYGTDEQITKRAVFDVDGPMMFKANDTLNFAHAFFRTLDDTIQMSANNDINLTDIELCAKRCLQTSHNGSINEYVDILTRTMIYNRSGRKDNHNFVEHRHQQEQRVSGNRYNLSGGIDNDAYGNPIPTFLQVVGQGQSITSQVVTINALNGLVTRYAPGGSIRQTAVNLNNWCRSSLDNYGKRFHNHWDSFSNTTHEVGGCVLGRSENNTSYSINEVAYNRLIKDCFAENAQYVVKRAGNMTHQEHHSMHSSKEGADCFSSGGSSNSYQSMTLSQPQPVMHIVGHHQEQKPIVNQPGTSTYTGPMFVVSGSSDIRRDQVYEPMQSVLTMTSQTIRDNCMSCQPAQFSVPKLGSHPLENLRAANQLIGYAKNATTLIQTLQTPTVANWQSLALQIVGNFTNFTSEHIEEYTKNREEAEVAPFMDYGQATFNNVSLSGVLAGMTTDSAQGKIALFDVRAPQFTKIFERQITQETDTVNPITVSFTHSESWMNQRQSASGSTPSSAIFYGSPSLEVDDGQFMGIAISTAQARKPELTTPGTTILYPTKKPGIFFKNASIRAAYYENDFFQESGYSSFGISLGPIVLAGLTGGVSAALAPSTLASLITIGFGGEEKSEHHSGTDRLTVAALGAAITIETLSTTGNVILGSGIAAQTHTHTAVPETHTKTQSIDRMGQMLEGVTGAYSLYAGVSGLKESWSKILDHDQQMSAVEKIGMSMNDGLDESQTPSSDKKKRHTTRSDEHIDTKATLKSSKDQRGRRSAAASAAIILDRGDTDLQSSYDDLTTASFGATEAETASSSAAVSDQPSNQSRNRPLSPYSRGLLESSEIYQKALYDEQILRTKPETSFLESTASRFREVVLRKELGVVSGAYSDRQISKSLDTVVSGSATKEDLKTVGIGLGMMAVGMIGNGSGGKGSIGPRVPLVSGKGKMSSGVGSSTISSSSDLKAPRPLLPNEGKIGTYGLLVGSSVKGDNLSAHHMPNDQYMKSHGVSKNAGVSLMVEDPRPGASGRHREIHKQLQKQELSLAPRDALAQSVQRVRQVYKQDGVYTQGIRDSLQNVVKQNKITHPNLFDKARDK